MSLQWDASLESYVFNAACLDALMSLVVVAKENHAEFADWLKTGIMSVDINSAMIVNADVIAHISAQADQHDGKRFAYRQAITYNQPLSQAAKSRLA